MVEPQIVINKTWHEHQQDLEIERLRREKAFKIMFGFIVIIFGIILISMFAKENPVLFSSIIIIILIAIVIVFGRKIIRVVKNESWQRIDKLPSWAYKKMKRRKTNVVNGEHYRYRKEGNKFYRRKK